MGEVINLIDHVAPGKLVFVITDSGDSTIKGLSLTSEFGMKDDEDGTIIAMIPEESREICDEECCDEELPVLGGLESETGVEMMLIWLDPDKPIEVEDLIHMRERYRECGKISSYELLFMDKIIDEVRKLGES